MYPTPFLNNRLVNFSPINGLLQKPISLSSSSKFTVKANNRPEQSSRNRPPIAYTSRFSNRDRVIPSKSSSGGPIPPKRSISLINSHSLSTLQDRIQRERKAYTLAPAAQISGPMPTPHGKMFASTTAPTDNLRQNPLKHSYQKFNSEMTDNETPIIVKVRYDAQTGVLPSKDVIQKAVDNHIFHNKSKNEPVIVNFTGLNIQPQISNLNFSQSFHKPYHFLSNHNNNRIQSIPLKNQQQVQLRKIPSSQLSNQNIHLRSMNRFNSKGFDTIKSNHNHHKMASQQSSNQQNPVSSSNEVFRPPSVKDIPELSQENILNMLNQIPDLQGRRFNIEYAPPSAPEGYPIPTHLVSANNSYPEPVIVDQLPTDVIQHVKNSNNPAITAALEATIQQEQRFRTQANVSALNVQPPTVMHHAAQPYQQVQQSRPVSSDESDSSTEVSSSETSSSSSEESDSEQLNNIPSAKLANNIPYVGPVPPRSNQYR